MAHEHPFQLLFESFGRLPIAHAESVNRGAFEELCAALDVPVTGSGRCILLRAPCAGHGKTHLLTRVQHALSGTHEFIPLLALGSRIDAVSATENALKRLTRPLSAAGGLTVLDLVIRRLFSFALQPLVASGEVPCQDRQGVLAALKSRPLETFDFHHSNAVTAQWARENFQVLGPRLSQELSTRSDVPLREVSFWVGVFFRYASTPIDHPGRAGALGLELAISGVTEGAAMERLTALLSLLSLLSRVVLVADELEGFSSDESAALQFSAFITTIRQSADRVDVILSLNQDIWQNAFVPRLSGGLVDRLSEVLIELEPLGDAEIIALLDSRAPGLGEQVYARVGVSERHARALVRAAGKAWVKASSGKRETVSASSDSPGAIGEPDLYHEPAEPDPAPVTVEVDENTETPEREFPPVFAPGADEVKLWEMDEPAVSPEVASPSGPESPADVSEDEAEEVVSPFKVAPPEAAAGPSPVQPATPVFKSGAEDKRRVDDLLKQFRERYGRGSL